MRKSQNDSREEIKLHLSPTLLPVRKNSEEADHAKKAMKEKTNQTKKPQGQTGAQTVGEVTRARKQKSSRTNRRKRQKKADSQTNLAGGVTTEQRPKSVEKKGDATGKKKRKKNRKKVVTKSLKPDMSRTRAKMKMIYNGPGNSRKKKYLTHASFAEVPGWEKSTGKMNPKVLGSYIPIVHFKLYVVGCRWTTRKRPRRTPAVAQSRSKIVVRESRSRLTGDLAEKHKVAGARKADRKERNLTRLVEKCNPPAITTKHASQRLRERGTATIPVYGRRKPDGKGGKREVIVTYRPTVGSKLKYYRIAKRIRDNLLQERDSKRVAANRSHLPRARLPLHHGMVLQKCTQVVKVEEHDRRMKQRMRAKERTGCSPSDALFFRHRDPDELETNWRNVVAGF
jgi:hypothetical protein